jgi:hypothetical protein
MIWIWIIVELSLWRLWDGLSGGFVDGRLALAEDFIEEDGFLGRLPQIVQRIGQEQQMHGPADLPQNRFGALLPRLPFPLGINPSTRPITNTTGKLQPFAL